MDNDGRKPPTSDDQHQKELSISLAASSMIDASHMLTQEAYQANLKRIQEVKEMVQRLEMNNEAAHKNFLVDQLEKRAKDGREAEVMLAQLRNQPGHSETVQFTNSIPSDQSEVVLPTTATLVEVPEPRSSHSSLTPTNTSNPQIIQHAGRLAEHQWALPRQVHQNQAYNPNVFPYYRGPPMVPRPSQHSAVPRAQVLTDEQAGWCATQDVPPQSRTRNPLVHQSAFQPIQVEQPSRSWNTYPRPVIAPPVNILPEVSGYYTSPAGRIGIAHADTSASSGPFNTMYPEPGLLTQSTTPQPLISSHNQPQNQPSLASTSQVQMQLPLQGVSMTLAKTPSTVSYSKPAETRSRPVSTAVSKPVAISELQWHHKPSQHRQQPQPQPQPLPQPPRSQQYSQQPQPQRLAEPPPQSQPHPQQSQELSSQRPRQLPQTHLQTTLQPSGNRIPSTSGSYSQNRPPPQAQLPVIQEQPRRRDSRPGADQATFVKLFQIAVQRGILQLKAFWSQAKASGVNDEWLRVAINSLPRGAWESIMTQVNQSGPTLDTSPLANVSRQLVSTIPDPSVPGVTVGPPLSTTTLVPTVPAIQKAAKHSTSTEGMVSVPEQASGPYAVQLQYYAEQAAKLALSAQETSISTSALGSITPTQKTVVTPTQDVPQTQANAKTPKDANKSTLARDVLRSLAKVVPKPCQETEAKPTDKACIHDGDTEANSTQSISLTASPKPPVILPPSIVRANSPLMPSAIPDRMVEPRQVAFPDPQKTTRSVSKEEQRHPTVIEGPIMIDLTLEDSAESIDGKSQEPESTFPTQTPASAATSLQPAHVSSTSTTHHTPLLENLSLEELPVVAADGNNADVGMFSRQLSLPPEENNIKSELLHSPLDTAGPVLPNSDPSATKYPLDGQLPLFLPSPPASPAYTEPPETDPEMTNDESKSTPLLKRRAVDVDEMEIDMQLGTPPVRKRRKQHVYVLIPPAPLHVKKAMKMKERSVGEDTDSDLEGVGEGEEFQYSHLEGLLIEESKSRLLERRCRWLNCNAVLNCAAHLLIHLKNHAREEGSQAPFRCRWASCQIQFNIKQERDVHFERHTIRPLPCPFAGCDERFDKPVEVMQHEVQHQEADRSGPLIRKPTCQPIVPAIPTRLGPPPHRLPSHRVIPRRVVKCRIPADRHTIVGPWVLWNIFSPVDLNAGKQNASMRGCLTRAVSYDVDSLNPRRDDYDFLLALSSHPAKNPQLDDLDSALITMSAARGLTLWGSGSAANSVAGSVTPAEHTSVDAAVPAFATEDTTAEGKSSESEVAAATSKREEQHIGEEDAVEGMLIL